jgi:hypothetical protein
MQRQVKKSISNARSAIKKRHLPALHHGLGHNPEAEADEWKWISNPENH